MTVEIKHAKTNTITDWTQPQLDDIIAGGAPPLPPSGTTLSEVVLPSDWNAALVLDGATAGEVLFSGASGLDSDPTKLFYDKTNTRLGIGTDAPDARVHVLSEFVTVPNPTGSVSVTETDIGTGAYQNNGNTFSFSIYTYKQYGDYVVYSDTFISSSYSDDGMDDHTYNALVTMDDPVPSGADGYRVFVTLNGSQTIQYLATNPSPTEYVDDSVNNITGSPSEGTHSVQELLAEDTNLVVKSSTGGVIFRVDPSRESIDINGAVQKLAITNVDFPTTRVLDIKSSNGAFATDYFRVRNYTDTTLFRIDSSGILRAGQIIATGTVQFTSTLSAAATIVTTLTASGAASFGSTANVTGILTASGTIRLNGASSNQVFFGANGTAIPSNGSLGQKIQLSGTMGSVGIADYAMGVESGFMWHTVGSGGGYKFYNNAASSLLTIGSTGIVTAASEFQSPTAFRVTAFGTYMGVSSAQRFVFNNTGIEANAGSTTNNVLRINLLASHTGNALDVRNSGGTSLTSINATGGWVPASMTDASAANNTVYYSTTASKLVYKDAGGTVNNLY
jgi:hypothetical protein